LILRDRISAGLAGLAIAIAVLAVGGTPRWAQTVVALLVAGALLIQLRSRRALVRGAPLVLLLLAAAAWTAIQMLPLPSLLVSQLSPTLANLRADGIDVSQISAWSTLSMDRGATLRALTFLLTLSGLAVISLRLASLERGRYLIVAFVTCVIGAAAAIAGLHELIGATSLYGIYAPEQATPPIMGPLLNANHLGCLTATGTVLSVGLFLHPKQTTTRRMMWCVIGAGCLAVTLATLSRGAVLAMTAGLLMTVGATLAQRFQSTQKSRRKREHLLARTVPVGIIIVSCLLVAVYLSAGSVVHQLEATTLQEIHEPKSKFAAWRSSFTLVGEAPWTGVGRGAFESTFTRVHPASALVTFSHVENEALQAVVEWGIPACVVLGGLAAWLVLLALRRWRDGPLAAAALGAMMVIAIQSNFDFGMELLGLAAPLVAVIAVVTYVPLLEKGAGRPRLRPVVRILHVLAIVGGGLLLLRPSMRSIEEDHLVLRGEPTRDEIHASIGRHPLDYFGFAVLAEQMLRKNDAGGVRVLNHALRLHPHHAGLHRIAARLLVRTGRLSQAESEYAATIRGSADPRPVLVEIVSALPPERVANAIPLELNADIVVRTLLSVKRPDILILWLERLLEHRGDLHSTEVLYSVAMDANRLDAAERASRRRCVLMPSTQCRLGLARVLSRAGKPVDVIAELQDVATWRGHRDDQIEAWLLLCDAHIAAQAPGDARRCLRKLEGSALVPPGDSRIQTRLDGLPPVVPRIPGAP